ncbi:hypothetical protein G5C33_17980 [Sphingosinithalassobacter tenebrarum]|uniref:Uncharacterized protein n=2 Tax=Stakelama tenebrarum TaxID=2711215 RepID=A0A6G6Y9V3_9SPHN|nr:hypothetical protein G5C33_17980 [Sphingosinithalassobacter tenebrarum]
MLNPIALALLPLFASVQTGSDVRLAQTLDAFDRQCATLDSIEGLDARATAAGWEAFTPEEDSAAGRLLGVTLGAAEDSGATLKTGTLRNADVEGRVLFLAQVVASNGAGSVECRLLDESTVQPPAAEPLIEWAGRAPRERTLPSGATSWFWSGGVHGEANFTVVLFVEPGTSAARAGTGLQVVAARMTNP